MFSAYIMLFLAELQQPVHIASGNNAICTGSTLPIASDIGCDVQSCCRYLPLSRNEWGKYEKLYIMRNNRVQIGHELERNFSLRFHLFLFFISFFMGRAGGQNRYCLQKFFSFFLFFVFLFSAFMVILKKIRKRILYDNTIFFAKFT